MRDSSKGRERQRRGKGEGKRGPPKLYRGWAEGTRWEGRTRGEERGKGIGPLGHMAGNKWPILKVFSFTNMPQFSLKF